MSAERQQTKEKSIWDSRLVKGGLVVGVVGGIFGIGLLVATGAAAAGSGATWYWASKGKS